MRGAISTIPEFLMPVVYLVYRLLVKLYHSARKYPHLGKAQSRHAVCSLDELPNRLCYPFASAMKMLLIVGAGGDGLHSDALPAQQRGDLVRRHLCGGDHAEAVASQRGVADAGLPLQRLQRAQQRFGGYFHTWPGVALQRLRFGQRQQFAPVHDADCAQIRLVHLVRRNHDRDPLAPAR